MALALLLLACGGNLSNEVFYQDAEFLAALPSRERFQVWYVEGVEVDEVETEVDLYELTLSAVGSADLYLEEVTRITDALRTLSPAVREEDYRLWGPYEDEHYNHYYLQVEMTRPPGGSSYTYHFSASEGPSGPWVVFFTGRHYAGETIEEGDGTLEWSLSRLGGAGLLTVEYDLRETLAVKVSLDQARIPGEREQIDAVWYHARAEDGGGDLEYTAWLEISEEGEESEQEHLEVRSRWNVDGEGRGDAQISAGDLGEITAHASQCWTADGQLTAQGSDYVWLAAAGDLEVDCPYPEAAEVENL